MSVSTTSMPVTRTTEQMAMTSKAVKTAEANKNGKESRDKYPENLAQAWCIWYPITFQKKSMPMLVLFNWSSMVNAIYPTFAKRLGLFIKSTDIGAQKIDVITLDIYRIVVAAFSMTNKANRVQFFQETFLVATVSPKVVFEMLFFNLSSADFDFLD